MKHTAYFLAKVHFKPKNWPKIPAPGQRSFEKSDQFLDTGDNNSAPRLPQERFRAAGQEKIPKKEK